MYRVDEPQRVEIKVGEETFHLTPLSELEAEKALLVASVQERANNGEDGPGAFVHLAVELLEIATDIPKELLMRLKLRDLKELGRLVTSVDEPGNSEPGAAKA